MELMKKRVEFDEMEVMLVQIPSFKQQNKQNFEKGGSFNFGIHYLFLNYVEYKMKID